MFNKINKFIWAIKYRILPWHRYHIVNTGLKPGFHDKDDVMIYAIFKILTDFVEKEKPFEHFDTEDSVHKEDWIKVKELYNWVKNDWPKIREHSLSNGTYELETEKALEIVKLRKMYWT